MPWPVTVISRPPDDHLSERLGDKDLECYAAPPSATETSRLDHPSWAWQCCNSGRETGSGEFRIKRYMGRDVTPQWEASRADAEEGNFCLVREMYQQFTLELRAGMHLTQLTLGSKYSDIHCQLMDDLQTLKLDQSNGQIVEFPLAAVSKVCRVVKYKDKDVGDSTDRDAAWSRNAEHVIVIEFLRRKLAFVFETASEARRFISCIEQLVRKAKPPAHSTQLTAAFPLPGRTEERCCDIPLKI